MNAPSSPDRPRAGWPVWTAATLGAVFAGIAIYVVASRVAFPFALELMEDGVAAQAAHVRDGGALYGAPTSAFAPYLYGPIYSWFGAAALAVVADQLWALRAVSLLATLLICLGVYTTARQLAGRWAGAVAVGLFAASYQASGAWFDLARVDMLHVAFLWGTLLLLRSRCWWGWPAVCAVLAIYTKQSAAAIVGAMAIGLAAADVRRAWRFGAAALAGSLLFGAALHLASDGWSTRFLFVLPRQHAVLWSIVPGVLRDELLFGMAPALLLAAVGARALWQKSLGSAMLPLAFLAASLLIGAAARLRDGGWFNAWIPAHAAIAVVAACGIVRLAASGSRRAAMVAVVLTTLQFVAFSYDFGTGEWRSPGSRIPSPRQRANAERVADAMAASSEPLWAPSKVFLLHRVGLPMHADGTALWDIGRTRDPELFEAVSADVLRHLADGSYRALLLNSDDQDALKARYPIVVPAYPPGENAHTEMPVAGKDRACVGYEQLYWYLQRGDAAMRERVR